MSLYELLLPFKRAGFRFIFLFFALFVFLFALSDFFTPAEKTTIYFSIKPQQTETSNHQGLDIMESSMKVTEMMAGWTQNPAFRESVLVSADTPVSNFKKKIYARKQNRTNLFVTLQLPEEDQAKTEKLINATLAEYEKRLKAYNLENPEPFTMTESEIFTETPEIPLSWKIVGAFILAFIGSVVYIFFVEVLLGYVSFLYQVRQIFPKSKILSLKSLSEVDSSDILEAFVEAESPAQFIGSFERASEYFTLDSKGENPVLLIKLGETKLREIQNFQTIVEDPAIVVFDK